LEVDSAVVERLYGPIDDWIAVGSLRLGSVAPRRVRRGGGVVPGVSALPTGVGVVALERGEVGAALRRRARG